MDARRVLIEGLRWNALFAAILVCNSLVLSIIEKVDCVVSISVTTAYLLSTILSIFLVKKEIYIIGDTINQQRKTVAFFSVGEIIALNISIATIIHDCIEADSFILIVCTSLVCAIAALVSSIEKFKDK